jgi:hypothetical protein
LEAQFDAGSQELGLVFNRDVDAGSVNESEILLRNADGFNWQGASVNMVTDNVVFLQMVRGVAAGSTPTLNYNGSDWASTTGATLDVFTGFPVIDI